MVSRIKSRMLKALRGKNKEKQETNIEPKKVKEIIVLDNTEPHTCHVCEKTDKEVGYQCGFCDWQWQHYTCGCDCTECGRPGYPEGMCVSCTEAFGPK